MKNALIKALSFVLVLSFALLCFTGCGKAEAKDLFVHVQGSIFSGKGDDSVDFTLKFSPDWITKNSNKKYNSDLAAFSALVAEDVYYREKDLGRGTPNRVLVDGISDDQYNQTVLLTNLGFTDVRYIESYREKEYETDANDSVTFVIGYLDTGKYDTFVVSVRGCFSAAEWYSIFDPGANVPEYEKFTGEHPEWTDRAMLKGVNIASNRAMEFINEYIAEHDNHGNKNSILITGHSRGGLIAQALGADFEDNKNFKSYTYTFNSDPITQNSAAENYQTIFNIFDSGDFFADIMRFGGESLYRYGKTLSLAITDKPDIQKEIAALKGRDDYTCMSEKFADDYYGFFRTAFPTRESLYQTFNALVRFETRASANRRYKEIKEMISAENGLDLGQFIKLSKVEKYDDGTYGFDMKYCKAVFLILAGKILAYGQPAYDIAVDIFDFDEEMRTLADSLLDNYSDISGGHLLLNSYVMTKYVK